MTEYFPLLGILVQYLRSVTGGKYRDLIVVACLVAAVAFTSFLEGEQLFTADWREAWGIHEGVIGVVLQVLGVTWGTSQVANAAVRAGANPEHVIVPATKKEG